MQGGRCRNGYYLAGLSMNGCATPLRQSYRVVSHVFLIVFGGNDLPGSSEQRPAAVVEIVGMMCVTQKDCVQLWNVLWFQRRTLEARRANKGVTKGIVALALVENRIGQDAH